MLRTDLGLKHDLWLITALFQLENNQCIVNYSRNFQTACKEFLERYVAHLTASTTKYQTFSRFKIVNTLNNNELKENFDGFLYLVIAAFEQF